LNILKKAFLFIVWWFIYYILIGVTGDIVVEILSFPIDEDTIVGVAFLTAIVLSYVKIKRKGSDPATTPQVLKADNSIDNIRNKDEQIDHTPSTSTETDSKNNSSRLERNNIQRETLEKSSKKRKKITKNEVIEKLIKERSFKQK